MRRSEYSRSTGGRAPSLYLSNEPYSSHRASSAHSSTQIPLVMSKTHLFELVQFVDWRQSSTEPITHSSSPAVQRPKVWQAMEAAQSSLLPRTQVPLCCSNPQSPSQEQGCETGQTSTVGLPD